MLIVRSSKIKIEAYTDDVIDRQKTVGHHEHPAADEVTIDREAGRCRKLADKQPLRNALASTVFPLFVNLLDEGGE